MPAYYNEIDPYAAAWLRNLISAGHIAPGDVDERDIRDVRPEDLKPYKQCHFFAGIGVWSYALRRAGWPDDRPVWTGSCPCQPFSQAGAGAGFDDERHLWPDFHWLIRERQPPVIFGEQVASKDADPWIDLVQADLEAMAYSFGAIPFPAAGVGAPHIRDRLYWMAYAAGKRRVRWERVSGRRINDRTYAGRVKGDDGSFSELQAGVLPSFGVADTGMLERPNRQPRLRHEHAAVGWDEGATAPTGLCIDLRPGPVNGFWQNADWLGCRDGKFRPVEPESFPLVDGSAFLLDSGSSLAGKSRAGMLKGAGNAINAEAAIAFIKSAMPSLNRK